VTGDADRATVRVVLPVHLRDLAGTGKEVAVEVDGPVTQGSVLDALETRYPVLLGTIRGRDDGRRRAFVRFFACGSDLSNDDAYSLLPGAVASGAEPFVILGAMAGG